MVERVRAAVPAGGAAVLGAAPHVLHHLGPLAGAALLAGVTGKLLFGALGFLLAVPRDIPAVPPGSSPCEHESHHR